MSQDRSVARIVRQYKQSLQGSKDQKILQTAPPLSERCLGANVNIWRQLQKHQHHQHSELPPPLPLPTTPQKIIKNPARSLEESPKNPALPPASIFTDEDNVNNNNVRIELSFILLISLECPRILKDPAGSMVTIYVNIYRREQRQQ